MTDYFEISSWIDQSTPIRFERSLFDRIDKIVEQSLKEKNPVIALSAGNSLLGAIRLGGLGLAKLLHSVNFRWKEYEFSGSLYELAESELGILAKNTVDRYIAVWEMLSGGYIPQDLMEYIKAKPMRQLCPIASLVAQGYDVSNEDWSRIAHAADYNEVAEIVRELKGKPPKKTSMKIVLEQDGTLNAWNNGKIVFIGSLRVEDEDKDETIKKAIERIVNNSGIVRR